MNTTPYPPITRHPQRLMEPRMVLVVEDDCALRELFEIILDHQGYQVLSAANAPEALAIAKSWRGEPIDLLITDIAMPCKNGDQLAIELRALLPNLRVIYLSGYAADDPFALRLNLHNALYLPKPASPHAVQDAIHSLFNRRHAEAA